MKGGGGGFFIGKNATYHCIRFYITSTWIEQEGPCCSDLKLFKYAPKPEQQGLSSLVCLDIMWI